MFITVKFFFRKYFIVLILIFFISLNLVGIFYNYPLAFTVGDEIPIMATVLKMIDYHTLRPDFPSNYHMAFPVYIYLPFYIILLVFLRLSGLFTSIDAIKQMGIMDYGELLPMARFISVILGVVSIYLVYKICRKIFSNNFIPLAASFLLSTSLMFIQMSHFGRVWLPQIFTILLAFYFIINLYLKESARLKHYLLSAFFIGISFGIHFVGLLIYFPFLIVHYLKNKNRGFKNVFVKNKNFWLANLIILIFSPILYYLNPYGFINYGSRVLNKFFSLGTIENIASSGNFFAKISYYSKILWEYEPILIILFVPSLVLLWFKKRNLFYIFSSFIFGYYIIISLIIGGEPRFILPIIPFMAVIVAYGLYYLYKSSLINKKIRILLLIVLFSSFLYLPLLWNLKFIQPSTRILAMNWVYRNLPVGAKIINLDAYLTLNKDRQTIENLKKYNIRFFTKKDDYLLTADDRDYPKPNYYILDSHYLDKVAEDFPKRNKFQYLIIHWWDEQQREEQLEKISRFDFNNLVLATKFYPVDGVINITDLAGNMRYPFSLLSKLNKTGPYIEIYQIESYGD